MTTVRINISANDIAPRFRALGLRFKAAAFRGTMRAAQLARRTLVKATRTARPANPSGIGRGGAVNNGEYLAAWTVQRTEYGARVYNAAKYASIIEYGRRPGKMPPSRLLIPWVMRKLHVPAKKAAGIAFVIARAIGRRGLIGRNVMGGSLSEIELNFYAEVQKELERELTRAGK